MHAPAHANLYLPRAGHMVYMGPREGVLPFFASLGFAPPARKGAADFLQVRLLS